MKRPVGNATEAREAAFPSIEKAARRARVSVAYLRQTERDGAPFALACRLSHLYGAPIDVFLKGRRKSEEGEGTPKGAITPTKTTRAGRRHPNRHDRASNTPNKRKRPPREQPPSDHERRAPTRERIRKEQSNDILP